jgi:capsule polysaccharide export protein KpsE/RkpR
VRRLGPNKLMDAVEPVDDVHFASPPEEPEPASRSAIVLKILRLLWTERDLLRRTAIWVAALSAAISFLIPSRYQSTVTMMPPDSLNSNGMMLAALAGRASGTPSGLAGMAGTLLGVKSTGALFVELLLSRTVQDRVVDKFHLRDEYGVRYEEDARKELNSRTAVNEDHKSGVIGVTVTDTSPQRAHDMAQAYVEELDHLLSQVSTSSARRERIFIEQRLTSVKADLEDAEKQFAAFASKNTALNIQEQTKAMVESAATLQGEVIAAQSELEGLEQIYTPNNVRVRAAHARIDELRRQLQKLGGTDSSLTPDSSTDLGELYPSIRKLPLLGVQWADLYRRAKIQETVYELLNQQYELARIQEAKEIPTVNIIDPPDVPQRKAYPHRLIIIVVTTTLALISVAGWILGTARWQTVPAEDPKKIIVASIRKKTQVWAARTALRLRLRRLARSIAPEATSATDPSDHL